MTSLPSLAIFGAPPLFDRPVRTGQRFAPAWSSYEEMFRGIFEREYYTNHGPLTQELERRLGELLGIPHAICMANDFLGLVSVAHALGLHDNVVVPGICRLATRQSLDWTGVRPLACDVDAETGMMTAELVTRVLIRHSAAAILAANPWGDACDVPGLEALAAERGIPLYLDSAHGFGCAIAGRPVGSFGTAEVISFHSDNIVGACEGAVVCTHRDDIAAHIRNTRSSYGMGPAVRVVKTGNGRMSEAQAAIALFNLDHFAENRQRNERLFGIFKLGFTAIPGLEVRTPSGVSTSNYQNLICLLDEVRFGLKRGELLRILRAENCLATGSFASASHPPLLPARVAAEDALSNTYRYRSRIIELPMNRALAERDAAKLVDLLAFIQSQAGHVRHQLAKTA